MAAWEAHWSGGDLDTGEISQVPRLDSTGRTRVRTRVRTSGRDGSYRGRKVDKNAPLDYHATDLGHRRSERPPIDASGIPQSPATAREKSTKTLANTRRHLNATPCPNLTPVRLPRPHNHSPAQPRARAMQKMTKSPLEARSPDRLTVWCRFFAKNLIQNVKLWQNSLLSHPKVLCTFQTGVLGVPGYCMGGGTY